MIKKHRLLCPALVFVPFWCELVTVCLSVKCEPIWMLHINRTIYKNHVGRRLDALYILFCLELLAPNKINPFLWIVYGLLEMAHEMFQIFVPKLGTLLLCMAFCSQTRHTFSTVACKMSFLCRDFFEAFIPCRLKDKEKVSYLDVCLLAVLRVFHLRMTCFLQIYLVCCGT